MGYSKEQVEDFLKALKEIPQEVKEDKAKNTKELIKLLSKEITSLQKRGYSIGIIAEKLRKKGLNISDGSLKSYLKNSKKTESLNTKKTNKENTPEKKEVKETPMPTPTRFSGW